MFSSTDPRYYLPYYRTHNPLFLRQLQDHFTLTYDPITYLHYYALSQKYYQALDVASPLFQTEPEFIRYCDQHLHQWLHDVHPILPHLFINPQWNCHSSFRQQVFHAMTHHYPATLLDRYFFVYREFSVTKNHCFDWNSVFVQHVCSLFRSYSFAWDIVFQELQRQSFHLMVEFEWALLARIEPFTQDTFFDEVVILC